MRNTVDKILLLYRTLQHLKSKQIYYRFFYFFKKKLPLNYTKVPDNLPKNCIDFKLTLKHTGSYDKQEVKFTFLNLSHSFENKIDWNYSSYGKLWTYNLNYFDFLHQENLSKKEGLQLIEDYINNFIHLKDGLEPYPISLRGINWIKFLAEFQIQNEVITRSLYKQYSLLAAYLEYHLLGNHLLENGFSLLFGAYYFKSEKFYKEAYKILTNELEEQILNDGAHFELSPMYHQIILYRLLDCINLVKHNAWKQDDLLSIMKSKANMMLGWLLTMTYKNGAVPHFNDATLGIAPVSSELFDYAQQLGLNVKPVVELSESGYRKFSNNYYELTFDVGNIGPDYIPGHAHADTFNFELHVNKQPYIVDTGISTYESNAIRAYERSTAAHNTVEIDGINQSEVWASFRVAKRAKIINLKESKGEIIASHDGYKQLGCIHQRTFKTIGEKKILIKDKISYEGKAKTGKAYIHFAPSVKLDLQGKLVKVNENLLINFSGVNFNIEINSYNFASAFNQHYKAQVIVVQFSDWIETTLEVL